MAQLAVSDESKMYHVESNLGFRYMSCEICGYNLFVEQHHPQPKGYRNINGKLVVIVCPNHHSILDFLTFQLIWSSSDKDEHLFKEFDDDGIQELMKKDLKAFEFFEKRVEPLIMEVIGTNYTFFNEDGPRNEKLTLRRLIEVD